VPSGTQLGFCGPRKPGLIPELLPELLPLELPEPLPEPLPLLLLPEPLPEPLPLVLPELPLLVLLEVLPEPLPDVLPLALPEVLPLVLPEPELPPPLPLPLAVPELLPEDPLSPGPLGELVELHAAPATIHARPEIAKYVNLIFIFCAVRLGGLRLPRPLSGRWTQQQLNGSTSSRADACGAAQSPRLRPPSPPSSP
jgi:hypothetical protein